MFLPTISLSWPIVNVYVLLVPEQVALTILQLRSFAFKDQCWPAGHTTGRLSAYRAQSQLPRGASPYSRPDIRRSPVDGTHD